MLALLLVALIALSLAACGATGGDKTDGTSSEPKNAEEAVAMYNDLMAQENDILSENTELWDKVFMAADKGMTMQEDGKNYGDFLLSTIESAKDQFTADELNLLQEKAETIRDIENKLTMIEEKYPEAVQQSVDDAMSVPAGSDMTTPPDDGSVQKFPAFEGKDLDGNPVKSDELFSGNAVTVVNFWFTTCNPCVGELADLDALNHEAGGEGRRTHRRQHLYAGRRRGCDLRGKGCAGQEGRHLSERVFSLPTERRESSLPTSLPIPPPMWLTAAAISWASPS